MKNKKTLIPFIAMLAASLFVVLSFFLPYASVTDERRETINKYPDAIFSEELGMTNSDAADMSLFEYLRVYLYMAGKGQSTGIAVTCVGMISTFAVLTLLATLFAALRKNIPVIVFAVLDLGVFFLMGWDFQARGAIGKGTYNFSVAYFLILVFLIVAVAAAIWSIIIKVKEKKAGNVQE